MTTSWRIVAWIEKKKGSSVHHMCKEKIDKTHCCITVCSQSEGGAIITLITLIIYKIQEYIDIGNAPITSRSYVVLMIIITIESQNKFTFTQVLFPSTFTFRVV